MLFLAGITMTIGVRRTLVFFFKRKQMRGNLCFFSGIALVFLRWAVIGMVLQVSRLRQTTTVPPRGLLDGNATPGAPLTVRSLDNTVPLSGDGSF